MKLTVPECSHSMHKYVGGGRGKWVKCTHPAKTNRGGKPFCGYHDPEGYGRATAVEKAAWGTSASKKLRDNTRKFIKEAKARVKARKKGARAGRILGDKMAEALRVSIHTGAEGSIHDVRGWIREERESRRGPNTEALIEAKAQELKAIRLEKGSAYATPSDPYMNYRIAGGRKYAVRRAMEKLARLIQRLETGKPVGTEEFGDAINILYIAWIWPDVYQESK